MSSQVHAESVEENDRAKGWCSAGRADPANLDFGQRMLRHFSHRCRNSLHGIKLGLYLLRKELETPSHSRWKDLVRTYDDIEKLFVGLERVYQSNSLTFVRSPLGQLFAERAPLWRARYPEWGRSIRLDPPAQDLPGDFDPSHLGIGLDRLVNWRAESALPERRASHGGPPEQISRSFGASRRTAPRVRRFPLMTLPSVLSSPTAPDHWLFCSWPVSPPIMEASWKPAATPPCA